LRIGCWRASRLLLLPHALPLPRLTRITSLTRHRHRDFHHRTSSSGFLPPFLSLLSFTAPNWLNLSFQSLRIDYPSLGLTPPAHIQHHLHPPPAAFPWASRLQKSQERVGKIRKGMPAMVRAIRVQTSPPPPCPVPLVMGRPQLSAHLPSAYRRLMIRRVHRMVAGSVLQVLP